MLLPFAIVSKQTMIDLYSVTQFILLVKFEKPCACKSFDQLANPQPFFLLFS